MNMIFQKNKKKFFFGHKRVIMNMLQSDRRACIRKNE
jgi:hypothetical protein